MKPIKLFMMLLGCKPAGRHTEQHDIYFNVAAEIKDLVPAIINFWPEAKAAIHLDAWREVTLVGGYHIEIIPKETILAVGGEALVKLFFINLGGYKKDEFEEFHYKMLVAAKGKGEAVMEARRTIFYRQAGVKGAPSHVDDKYGLDVDELCEIEELLPPDVKDKYTVVLTEDAGRKPDEIHLGYMRLDKL